MERKSSLAYNTAMLYVLTASNYIFGFLTIPYLTRVLGVEIYGQIGFATAFSTYVQVVLDFGFILSATAAVARCEGDIKRISSVLTAVTCCKFCFVALSFAVVLFLILDVGQFSCDPGLFIAYFAYVSINSLIPDYVYRGLERMTIITVRTVTVKGLSLLGIFLFVKGPEQYHLIPIFYLIGALLAVVFVYSHLKKQLGIWFVVVRFGYIVQTAKESFQYFVSRVAATFYGSMNMMILGLVFPGSAVVGQFSACNNIVAAGRALASPVADSLFPYMVRTSRFGSLVRVALIGEAVLVPCCVVAGIFSYDLCGWFFGAEYYEAGGILRVLIALVPIALASYLFGFPALTPLGKARVANTSVMIGAAVQTVLVAGMFALGHFDVLGLCYATVATELVELLVRVVAFIMGVGQLKKSRQS